MPVITTPVPPPMRDKFIGDTGRNTDQNTGMSQPWVRWILNIFTTLTQQVASIQGSTIITANQSDLAALASTLSPANAGQIVFVEDYNHSLRWDGTGFGWGPGDNGSGYITPFFNDPSPTTGWQLCDGTTTTKLNSDGTVSAETVPDYSTASYLKLATTLAAGPTAPGGFTTAVSAGTPSGTNSNPDTGNESADTTVQAGAGATVAAAPHHHPTTAPVFTGNALGTHTHGAGSIELERTQLKAWYRR